MKKNRLAILGVIVLVCISGIVIVLCAMKQPKEAAATSLSLQDNSYRYIQYDGIDYSYNTSLITMLIIGVDSSEAFEDYAQEYSNTGSNGRADSIFLVTFDRAKEKINVLAISRDSMIDIKVTDALGKVVGWRKDHLALAYSYGNGKEKSCQFTVDAVSKLLGDIPIRYYAGVNLTSLQSIMNIVGELEVEVPNDDLEDFGENYKQGSTLTVTADNVERFVRYRDIGKSQSNEGRMERQQIFVNSYISKLKMRLSVQKEDTLKQMSGMFSNIITNISLGELADLSDMILNYEFNSENDYKRLPGETVEGTAHDEFYPDEQELKQMILEMFYKTSSES